MKKISRILAMVLALALVSALPLGALAEPALSFWHTYCGADAKTDVMASILEKYQADNPGVKLEIENVNSAMDSMGTRITTALSADDLPDVYMYWGGFTLEAVLAQDKLMNVQEYLDASDVIKYESIDSAAWAFYTVDGVIRGIPIEGALPVWLCNKAIFDQYGLELPKTMDDVKALAKTFSENGLITLAMGSSGGNPGHFFYSALMQQLEGGTAEIEAFGDTHAFNTPNHIRTAQEILDLREAGVFPQDTVANGDWTPCAELYNSGKAAMVFTYNWCIGGMSQETLDNSVIIDIPAMSDCAVDPSTLVQSSGNYGIVITQRAWEDEEKRPYIVKLLDTLLCDENYQQFVNNGVVSIKTTDVTTSEGVLKDIVKFYEGRTRVPAHFNTTKYRDGWSRLLTACDELFAGTVTADEFVQNVQDAYDEAADE